MGHYFCRSHWKIFPRYDGQPGEETEWHETPCFQAIRGLYETKEWIETEIRPTFAGVEWKEDNLKWPCRQTPEQALQYIADVQEALPGVVEVRSLPENGPYIFRYKLGTHANYWKFLAVASLMRYVEEFWGWTENYHNYRKAGIPRDVALFACNLRDMYGQSVGHGFSSDFQRLVSFKDFSLERILLQNPKLHMGPDIMSLWGLLTENNQHFEMHRSYTAFYPATFPLTNEVYKAFCQDTSDEVRRDLIKAAIATLPIRLRA